MKLFIALLTLQIKLECTARYAGLPIAPAEGFGLMQSYSFTLLTKKNEVLGQFMQFLGFSKNLSNVKKNHKM